MRIGLKHPMEEVGAASREVASLHLAASLAAAVPVPPVPPAGPPPGSGANAARPVIADLYNTSAPVFDPAATGGGSVCAPMVAPSLQTCSTSSPVKQKSQWVPAFDYLHVTRFLNGHCKFTPYFCCHDIAHQIGRYVTTTAIVCCDHKCLGRLCRAESQALAAAAVGQAAGSALLLKAAAAERAGAPGLATAHALTHLLAHSQEGASADERAVAHAQLLRLAADQRGYRAAEQVPFGSF